MPDAPTSQAGEKPPTKILIVEDEMLIAMLLEDIIADLGHVVVGPFHSFDTAMRAVADEHYDIAILDVNLGPTSSAPIAEELQRRGVPFAFATGHSRDHLDPRFFDARMIAKPFDDASLDAAIRALIAG